MSLWRGVLGFFLYCAAVPLAEGATAAYPPQKITPHVSFIRGPINGVLITQAGKSLAVYGDPRPDSPSVEKVLFTHQVTGRCELAACLLLALAGGFLPCTAAKAAAETKLPAGMKAD